MFARTLSSASDFTSILVDFEVFSGSGNIFIAFTNQKPSSSLNSDYVLNWRQYSQLPVKNLGREVFFGIYADEDFTFDLSFVQYTDSGASQGGINLLFYLIIFFICFFCVLFLGTFFLKLRQYYRLRFLSFFFFFPFLLKPMKNQMNHK